jgi:hypothetical protein
MVQIVAFQLAFGASSARTQNCCHKQRDRSYPAVHTSHSATASLRVCGMRSGLCSLTAVRAEATGRWPGFRWGGPFLLEPQKNLFYLAVATFSRCLLSVNFTDAGSVWLQEFESSMKGPRGTNEIAVHDEPGRLNWSPFGADQLKTPNRLA